MTPACADCLRASIARRVDPMEAERLAAPKRGCREEDPERIERIVCKSAFVEEPSECFGAPRLDLPRLHGASWRIGASAGLRASRLATTRPAPDGRPAR